MPNTYLTLTIGPVVETLLTARHTREMWAASYLFSYIVRETIREVLKKVPKENLLLPILQDENTTDYTYGAGLYPDRIFLKSDNPASDEQHLKEALEKTLRSIGEKSKGDYIYRQKVNGIEKKDTFSIEADDVSSYLRNHLRVNILSKELEGNENIVLELSPFLDVSEQYSRVLPPERPDSRSPLMLLFYNANNSFLKEEGFGGKRPDGVQPQRGFDSLMEIATKELQRLDPLKYKEALKYKDDEEKFIKILKKEFPSDFKSYHKYVAIVHVDGDNVGKIVGKVGDDTDKLKAFSARLRKFALNATRAIYEYGGAPVYAGGDDLLFFAPVACAKNEARQTIFHLFKELDLIFNKDLVVYARELGVHEVIDEHGKHVYDKEGKIKLDDKLLPSLSYGVSISFYKYPLFEARNASYGQLEKIKNDQANKKNGIGVKFLKHSGHAINFSLRKHRKKTYTQFLKLLGEHTPEDDSSFLNSFTYKLDSQRILLTQIANDQVKLQAFFENNFNEVWGKYQHFLQGLIPFIMALHEEATEDEKLIKKDAGHKNWLQLLYATLRFIHFLKSKDSDDE